MAAVTEISNELTKLGKEIEYAKSSIAQLNGREAEILSRIKEEFKVTSLLELADLIETTIEKKVAMEKSISQDFDNLKGKFSW